MAAALGNLPVEYTKETNSMSEEELETRICYICGASGSYTLEEWTDTAAEGNPDYIGICNDCFEWVCFNCASTVYIENYVCQPCGTRYDE